MNKQDLSSLVLGHEDPKWVMGHIHIYRRKFSYCRIAIMIISMYYWADCNDEKLFVWALQGVAINFVRKDDIRILRDIEQYYSTQIEEKPMKVADLICATAPRKVWLGVAVRSGREGLCNLSGAEICLFTFLVTA